MSNSTFNHPLPDDQSVYPYNHVTQTRAGHVFEVDDTLGNERIHEAHKSGTSRTIHPNGALSVMVVSNRYTAVCGEDSITVTGNSNVTINGSANLTVNGNYNLEVNGSMSQTVKGEYFLKVGAAYKNEVLGDKAENIVGKKDTIIGNGLSTTIRAGGITNMVIGDVTDSVMGGHTEIFTGSCATTALLGASISSPTGAVSIAGMKASLESATTLNLTSLAATVMLSSYTNITTSIVTILGGGLLSAGDVRAGAGITGLLTHIHIGDGTGSIPAPTLPGIG